jgi:hypothetical protein
MAMTRVVLICTVALHILALPAVGAPASAPSPPPAFNTIRTPTSPAFTLLGVEPSAVERPNTPASLALAFVGKARQADTVPNDLAVEISPYWLLKHSRLDWDKDDKRSLAESLLRTASVSVATGQVGSEDSPVTGLSMGARASLFSGHLSKDTRQALADLQAALTAESALGLRLMQEPIKALNAKLKAGEISPAEHARLMEILLRSVVASEPYVKSEERQAVEKLMQKFATNREGFFFEVAAATAWDYPNAIWAQRRLGRWGIWATPSYQTGQLSVVGVARYLSKDGDAGKKALDVGLRGTYSRDRYAISAEYVRRRFRDSDLQGGHRFVGIAEYALFDGTWLVASVGREYSAQKENSLIARLGMSFNFSQERYAVP